MAFCIIIDMDWFCELTFDIVLLTVLYALDGSSFHSIRPEAEAPTRFGAEFFTDFAFVLRKIFTSDLLDTGYFVVLEFFNKLFVCTFLIEAGGNQNYIP